MSHIWRSDLRQMVNKSNSPICQISLAGYSLRVSGLECPLVSASIHWWWCLCRSCVGMCVCVCCICWAASDGGAVALSDGETAPEWGRPVSQQREGESGEHCGLPSQHLQYLVFTSEGRAECLVSCHTEWKIFRELINLGNIESIDIESETWGENYKL